MMSRRFRYAIAVLFTIVLPAHAFAQSQSFSTAFWKRQVLTVADCLVSPPAIGGACGGGAIYAGQFDGGRYMITPGGCTNSATPTCASTNDTLTKIFRGTGGTNADVYAVEEVFANTDVSSSNMRGHVNTVFLTEDPSIASTSAADFCASMSYAGFSDWYLPSKSEMAFIYCHAQQTGTHSTSNPQEDPNCTAYGGKTTELKNFGSGNYLTSTEASSSTSWVQSFTTGSQATSAKSTSTGKVRCVRRYSGSTPAEVAANLATVTGLDTVSPATASTCKNIVIANRGDITTSALTVAFRSGASYFDFAGCTDTCSGSALGRGDSCYIGVRSILVANGGATGTIRVSATTGGFVDVDLQGTGSGYATDICASSPSIGAICGGGPIYIGQFDGGKYMITPPGCTDSLSPVCSGSLDTLAKAWAGPDGSYVDIAGVETVGGIAVASAVNGGANTFAASVDASVVSDSAIRYCQDMTFGGYSDWFLPSKSELAYIYCHADIPNYDGTTPEENPGCAALGGKSSDLKGFQPERYLSSSEIDTATAWARYFNEYGAGSMDKRQTGNSYVRCVRRYGGATAASLKGPAQISLTMESPEAQSMCKTVGVFNSGDSPTSPLSVAITAGSSDFETTGCTDTCTGVSLAGLSSCSVGVRIKTAATGVYTGTIQISAVTGGTSTTTLNGSATGYGGVDVCAGTPARGTRCTGGALYAGTFDSGKYMVTPSGCTNSATPTCAGGTDTFKTYWAPSADVAAITNVANSTNKSSSSQRGGVTTAAAVSAGADSQSAAGYCDSMVYGGYSDWYLPSKSELAYLYCHSAPAPSHASYYPDENPNCTLYGGKTYEIPGFAVGGSSTGYYWSSTESTFNTAWWMAFSNGSQSQSGNKGADWFVRCMRRY